MGCSNAENIVLEHAAMLQPAPLNPKPCAESARMMIKLSLILAATGLMLLLVSVLPGQAAPAAAPAAAANDIAYGKALFSAKGCVTCHRRADVAGSGFASGDDIPDLTTNRWNADYLRAWLQNPAAIKPRTAMPNLGLKPDEIEALIAFLSAGSRQ